MESGACAVLEVRVVAAASLRVIPLVGARPGHVKRAVPAELLREGSVRPAVYLARVKKGA